MAFHRLRGNEICSIGNYRRVFITKSLRDELFYSSLKKLLKNNNFKDLVELIQSNYQTLIRGGSNTAAHNDMNKQDQA
jgi:hypothetical protein